MSIQTMNEYRVTHADQTEETAVCSTVKQAANTFESTLNPITQIVRTKVGLQVTIPETVLDVNFRTVISGSGAESAGCRATPTTFAVADGSEVIFEAFAAAGYNFLGWFIGTNTSGTPEATTEIASIAITASIGVSQDVIITALFAPVS